VVGASGAVYCIFGAWIVSLCARHLLHKLIAANPSFLFATTFVEWICETTPIIFILAYELQPEGGVAERNLPPSHGGFQPTLAIYPCER
jgi:hypothetical protein